MPESRTGPRKLTTAVALRAHSFPAPRRTLLRKWRRRQPSREQVSAYPHDHRRLRLRETGACVTLATASVSATARVVARAAAEPESSHSQRVQALRPPPMKSEERHPFLHHLAKMSTQVRVGMRVSARASRPSQKGGRMPTVSRRAAAQGGVPTRLRQPPSWAATKECAQLSCSASRDQGRRGQLECGARRANPRTRARAGRRAYATQRAARPHGGRAPPPA